MCLSAPEVSVVTYYMVCRDCKEKFTLTCECVLPNEERVCPQCGSTRVRQRLTGVLRNLDVAAHDGEKLRPKKCA
jgi:rRNA maturation endonuclease Nob1